MRFNPNHFFLLVIAWPFVNQAEAQITITQSQFQSIFSAGNTLRFYSDTSRTSANVGKKGGPNIYDFHSLPFHIIGRETVFAVSQIPKFAARFASTSLVLKQSTGSGALESPVFSFSNQSWLDDGKDKFFSPTLETFTFDNPKKIMAVFPVTLNAQWGGSYSQVETTITNGIPAQTGTYSGSNASTVDGYGTLLLPGGLSLNCLRAREVDGSTKTFNFITQEGAFAFITSSTSQPDTGVVITDESDYFLGGSLSAVEEAAMPPTKLSLSQNYPNPFNPSTTILYELPSRANVSIRIFNPLGQPVATLFEGQKDAGRYSVQWNASMFSSGMYFIRLEAGTYSETKKMILLK